MSLQKFDRARRSGAPFLFLDVLLTARCEGSSGGASKQVALKLTQPTQIYLPGVAANDRDSIFDPALLAEVQDSADGKVATFHFVVKTQ